MDEREIEFRERNEKNKDWHKRMKIYYFGVYAPWAVMWLFVFFDYRSPNKSYDMDLDNGCYFSRMVCVGYCWYFIDSMSALWCVS